MRTVAAAALIACTPLAPAVRALHMRMKDGTTRAEVLRFRRRPL